MSSKGGGAVAAGSITKFAILMRRTELKLVLPHDTIADASNNRLSKEAGTLIKVFQSSSQSSSSSQSQGKPFSTVQILDFVRHDPIYENLYECPHSHLLKVSEDLWPYVIGIEAPERRLYFVQRNFSWVVYLKPNDFVSVPGALFGQAAQRYDCIVRYIGPVEQLNPVGYFFGLELLNLECGHSPQAEDIPFVKAYMDCEPSLSIFTTADRICPVSSDLKKKFSALELISGTFEKVRTAIAPAPGGGNYSGTTSSTTVSSAYSTNSLRRGRKPNKPKEKEATAKFYAIPATPTPDKPESNSNPLDRHFGNCIDTPSAAVGEMEGNSKRKPPPQVASNAPTDNDEFTQSIENYEKTLERQHHGNAGATAKHIPNLAAPPAGILKKPPSTAKKPLTIMSLEDRDIIVIDKADIRDEANVIVVDKQRQQDVDLVELLGGNWPNTAGDAASMLNKTQLKQQQQQTHELKQLNTNAAAAAAGPASAGGSSNSSVSSLSQSQKSSTLDRNRSPNPMTHLANAPQRTMMIQKAGGGGGLSENRHAPSASLNSANRMNNAVPETANELPPVAALTLEEEEQQQEPDADPAIVSPLQEVPDDATGLGVGSMVEVYMPDAEEEFYYGVIRWIGVPPGGKNVLVGVELEDDPCDRQLLPADGSFNGVALFKCHEGRALFVAPDRCANDRRFLDVEGATGNSNGKPKPTPEQNAKMFGNMECPPVKGIVVPRKCFNLEDLEEICGKFKGIQGHHNSCYLDATFFAMFMFTYVFDSLMYRKPAKEDIPEYREVQMVIHEEIVNPLRKNLFVRADKVMKLRELLDKLSSVSGLTTEEKDPEEFLNCLLSQIMRVEPFLQLSPGGQESYYYQLFVEKDERLTFPTVQQLFEQSFHASDIKLLEVPSCLIIQMPRFGKNYKMYPRILPSQVLDVTDIIDDSPRQCTVCGRLAEFECRDCFGIMQGNLGGLECTSFCANCLATVHQHSKRANHTHRPLTVPADFLAMAKHTNVPRRYMELFAVVCIETSHYVTFARAGPSPDSPWCFFDSMADRKGEHNGYNIPEVVSVPELTAWLSEEGARTVNETSSNDKMLPEHAKRLFCDAYMCMYQSKEVMMYR